MKKLIAFSTALLMLSSLSASLVYADDEPVNESETTVSDETAETTETTEENVIAEAPAEAETPENENSAWHVHASEPAEAVFTDDSENREYIVNVVNPGGEKRGGTDKWDLQFRVRGIEITEGHEYTIKYRISANANGSYYTKIGNLDSSTVGDAVAGEAWHNQYGTSTIRSYLNGVVQKNSVTTYGDAWSNRNIEKGDTLDVVCNFTGIADIPEAEWCFFLGGAGSTTSFDCFKEGNVVRFSNLVLTDDTTGETIISAYPSTEIAVKGDIDNDGKTDITDLTLMSLAMLGDKKLDEGQTDACDLDGDGKFTLADIAHLRQYLSKVIDEL